MAELKMALGVITPKGYNKIVEGLKQRGFHSGGSFQQNTSIFETFVKDRIIILQYDIKGRAFVFFKQVNEILPQNILKDLDREAQIKTLKPIKTWLTKLADKLNKFSVAYYGN